MNYIEKDIIIPSSDDIIAINEKLGGSVIYRGSVDFRLNTSLAGLVYISLMIANNSQNCLYQWTETG